MGEDGEKEGEKETEKAKETEEMERTEKMKEQEEAEEMEITEKIKSLEGTEMIAHTKETEKAAASTEAEKWERAIEIKWEPEPETLREYAGEVIRIHGSIYKIRKMRGYAKRLAAEERGRESAECHDFEPEEEKVLSETVRRRFGSDFVFVTHYPASKRPFYVMEDPENPGETLSFDLIFRGLEVTTGGQRIHDYRMRLEKIRQRGLNPEDFEGFLMMHKHGMLPHGGLGIGLERLTARILGFENVRQACLFPRDVHRLEP